MKSNRSGLTKILLGLAGLCFATTALAQEGAKVKTVTSSYNQLEILLIILMIILAAVIWGMGQALIAVAGQALEKHKKKTSVLPAVVLLLGLSLVCNTTMAQDAADEVIKEVPNYGGLSSTAFYMYITVIVVELCTILFLAFFIHSLYVELLPEKKAAVVKRSNMAAWWARIDKKFFTKAIPVEREADILLDHDYDGIQELDNNLPPWWKYGFYISIIAAVIYLFNFHVFHYGKNPTEEYMAEMQNAAIEKEIYEAKNKDKIDENNVPMADANGLAIAKEIFTAKCYTCHGKLGEGGAGPNLTDDYWLHKGSLNDVYHSIKVGYADKGMQSWEKVYTPKVISYLASFIKTLHGTNPAGAKAPQGDLFTEQVTDSSKAITQEKIPAKQ
jgi:cytochrome c oxidase cbb3-type subunit 3